MVPQYPKPSKPFRVWAESNFRAMVWDRIALVSLLLVVPAAGQCDEGTCQSLQPYFNCHVNFGEGAAGAANMIAFAVCRDIGDVVVRVGFVGDQPLRALCRRFAGVEAIPK